MLIIKRNLFSDLALCLHSVHMMVEDAAFARQLNQDHEQERTQRFFKAKATLCASPMME